MQFWMGVGGDYYQFPTHHSLNVFGLMIKVRQLLRNENQLSELLLFPLTMVTTCAEADLWLTCQKPVAANFLFQKNPSDNTINNLKSWELAHMMVYHILYTASCFTILEHLLTVPEPQFIDIQAAHNILSLAPPHHWWSELSSQGGF